MDDDQDLRDIGLMLDHLGYEAEFAADGAEAIKKKAFFFVLSFLENFERPRLFFL